MGGINFALVTVWVLSRNWPSRKLQVSDYVRRLGEAAAPGQGKCGPCPDVASNTLEFALQLRKITENFRHDTRKRSADQNANSLVNLVIAGDGLDWPDSPCRTWFHVRRLGQPSVSVKYLPSCRNRGSPHQLTFSKSSQSGF